MRGTDDAVQAAVAAEQKRCYDIVSAARFGEIDRDWRSILSMIESGETIEQIQQRGAYPP
jgi:hypothetical protein